MFRMLVLGFLLVAMPALAQGPKPTPLSAAPGRSGGEGGGSTSVDATVPEATKADPIFKSNVGQPVAPPTGNDPVSKCLRIAYGDFTKIPNAPTQVVDASVHPATADTPEVCIVNAFIAPQVFFRIWLPTTTWNGKFMQSGCGGRCGEILTTLCDYEYTRGYACMANDLGHRGTTYDNVWAIGDVPAEIDFGFRATHVASIVGKIFTKDYYGKAPTHNYFVGASTGGRQALVEVQRFPTDFDGVISGESGGIPPGEIKGLNQPRKGAALLYANGAPVLTPDEIRMVHKAVLDRCDADDGLKDGIIGDPYGCAFKPKDLLCKGAKTPACLDQHQVDVLTEVYATGPAMGSEIAWIGAFVAADGSPGRYIPKSDNGGYSYPYSWVFNDVGNPDIRGYKLSGGKFIYYTGAADEGSGPNAKINYYETVERVMGGRDKTQDFFRFYLVPGQSHIPGNVGAESLDYVQALEDWVEKGKAPDELIGHKLKRITRMMGPVYLAKDLVPTNYLYSRPIYPYPIIAKYRGKGDPDDAASFGPWDPVKKAWVK